MDIQNQVRLNRVVVDLLAVDHSLEQNKIGEQEALRKLNKVFDTLIDIRDECPDDDIQNYIDKAWDRIALLTLN